MALKLKTFQHKDLVQPILEAVGAKTTNKFLLTSTLSSVSIAIETNIGGGPEWELHIPISYSNMKKVVGVQTGAKKTPIDHDMRRAYVAVVLKVLAAAQAIVLKEPFGEAELLPMFSPYFDSTTAPETVVKDYLANAIHYWGACFDVSEYVDLMDTIKAFATHTGFSHPGKDLIHPDWVNDPKPDVQPSKPKPTPNNPAFTAKATTEAEMLTKTPVPLLQAETMYQPVSSTSAGSKYFVVALANNGLKFAARLKNNGTLSVRCEGPVSSHKSLLTKAGLDIHSTSNAYASGHFSCQSIDNATKCLGAVLAGIAKYLTTPMPDASLIAGKGK